ncbi:hypothetical protein JYU34_022012 [Plutella xylostella]|uniref:Secreted protein n=1 Tax=Plutella xylostella TaxID=51655 RepID=A0ABQ7PRV2_PLUXY|nr:hypothetical protein JYU34_022012 [Plutella xylostella]
MTAGTFTHFLLGLCAWYLPCTRCSLYCSHRMQISRLSPQSYAILVRDLMISAGSSHNKKEISELDSRETEAYVQHQQCDHGFMTTRRHFNTPPQNVDTK